MIGVDAWLAVDADLCINTGTINVFTLDPADSTLECGTSCKLVDWPFLTATTNDSGVATFHTPRFGGHGQLMVQYELLCNCNPSIGYAGLECIEARSTDFDATGHDLLPGS